MRTSLLWMTLILSLAPSCSDDTTGETGDVSGDAHALEWNGVETSGTEAREVVALAAQMRPETRARCGLDRPAPPPQAP